MNLPDHESATMVVTAVLIIAFVLWLVVVPVICSKSPLGSLAGNPIVTTLACCATICWILLELHPNNSYSTRRVFHAPLFRDTECQTIVAMTDRVAALNIEHAQNGTAPAELLQEPALGWHKTRDFEYPTTDLHSILDPFTKEERSYLEGLLDRRLAPIVSRIYGIPARALRVNDLFFVRYDAYKNGKVHLRNHVDGSDISFNILLNNDFTEGGTRFYQRTLDESMQAFGLSQPTAGSVLLHTSRINHEGNTVTSGTRRIIVGFFAVNDVDVQTREPTGLGILNSWCNLNYIHVKLWEAFKWSDRRIAQKRALWRDDTIFVALLRDLINFVQLVGDTREHELVELVDPKQKDAFLTALDAGYQGPSGTNWYRGQHLDVDIDGRVFEEWETRRQYRDIWSEL